MNSFTEYSVSGITVAIVLVSQSRRACEHSKLVPTTPLPLKQSAQIIWWLHYMHPQRICVIYCLNCQTQTEKT